jgi:hypothetical protein
MGYQIRMAAEVRRWLEKLRETDPGTGVLVDEALAVLGDRGASAGPPLVVPVEEQPACGGLLIPSGRPLRDRRAAGRGHRTQLAGRLVRRFDPA